MANTGKFNYVPVKDFLLLELAFLTIATKDTKSFSLAFSNISISDVFATWAEV